MLHELEAVAAILGSVATALACVAAWAAFMSPRAKAAKTAKADESARSLAVYQALFGTPSVQDNAGAEIVGAKAGLIADMLHVKAKLDAPILNGKGDNLIATVGRIDRKLETFGRRLRVVERHVVASTEGDA